MIAVGDIVWICVLIAFIVMIVCFILVLLMERHQSRMGCSGYCSLCDKKPICKWYSKYIKKPHN